MLKRTLSILIALALLFSCALAEFSTDVDAINRVAQSVVVLEHSSGTSTTAAVIGENLILSDACVSIDPDEWTVWTETGDSFGIAEIVKEVGSTNIAVCALSGDASLTPISAASAKSLRRGETVTVLGSPLGQVNTVSTGTVGAVFEDDGTTWIQINSALPGSTSGVLINESGRMVGLVTTVFDGGDSVARGIYYALGTESLPVTISEEAPAPIAEPTAEPESEAEEASGTSNWLLIDDGKLKIEIKSFEHEEYSNGHSILRMFADVVNNTGRLINIGLNNEKINGVEADGTGMMGIEPGAKISADSGEKFFFFSTLGGASPEPLKNPQTLSFDIHVYDDSTNEDLYNFSAAIDGPNAPQQNSPTPAPTEPADPAQPADPAEPAKKTANGWLLHDANGLRVEVTDFVFERYSTGSTYLTMYTTVTNNTGHEINMYLEDASVNGVEVDSNGMLHIPDGGTFTEEDDECFFMPLEDGDANAIAQLENPRTVSFSIRAVKCEGYDELMLIPITVSGSDLLNEGGSAPAPVVTPAPTVKPAEPADEGLGLVLCDQNNLRIVVTDFVFESYAADSNYLTMYTTVTNNTGHEIHVRIEDASINGVEVDSNGMLSIPNGATYNQEDDECFFMPLEKTDANAIAQLKNPQTLQFTLRVVTAEDYDELYNVPIKINAPGASDTDTPVAPTAAAFYPYLCKGDKGDDVRVLQMRLITLGYLNDSADGVYGNNTAQAVYDFRQQNGLTDVSDKYAADQEMQIVLFGPGAKYYTEPEFGLIIPNPSTGQWEKLSDDNISFRIQVKNITKTRTIKAFELYMYATDANGERIYGDGNVYYETTTKNVGPGKTVYSEYMTMPNRSRIDKIYAAIVKIVYSDGTVVETSDRNYDSWNID